VADETGRVRDFDVIAPQGGPFLMGEIETASYTERADRGRCDLHWMIVEDEADIRTLVSTMATIWGHTPLTFESGGKAWEWLDTVVDGTNTKPIPEFALMDIRMPGKTGDQVAQRLREIPEFVHIPVVLMTAFVLTDDDRRYMVEHARVDAIINKPLPDFMQLRDILHNVIDKKRSQTE
jgi:two-component system, sensor histidine kinase and response regulator